MSKTKDIQRRIKSVKNTGKITRAMEMVSAVKMRKAISSVLAIRPYAQNAWKVLTNVTASLGNDITHPLLDVREVKNVLVIMITANKGLCGSFNAQIIKQVTKEIQNPENLKINRVGNKKIYSTTPDKDIKIDFINIGKKGVKLATTLQKDIIAEFHDMVYAPAMFDVRQIAKIASDGYIAKKYDKVVIAYTDYISTLAQHPRIRQILPVSKIDFEKQVKEMDELADEYALDTSSLEYIIEPEPEVLLEDIFFRIIEIQIYHAILESNASKESARMIAMKGATDSAKEMVFELTLTYNQMRQRKITQEIAEISAGRAALE